MVSVGDNKGKNQFMTPSATSRNLNVKGLISLMLLNIKKLCSLYTYNNTYNIILLAKMYLEHQFLDGKDDAFFITLST